jgi:predicted transcriptional regulator
MDRFVFCEVFVTEGDIWRRKYRRSGIEILADILKLLRLGNTGKIQITHLIHLNSEQASNYINGLLEAGLLEGAEEEMGLPSFRITKKGLAALSLMENIREMLPPQGSMDILHGSKIVEINIGRILVTRKVAELSGENREFALFVQQSLDRYRIGDWGNIDNEANRLNSSFLERNLRLFSSYGSDRFPEIWITTEPDRSYSTIMFPDEDTSMEPLQDYWSREDVESTEVGGVSDWN